MALHPPRGPQPSYYRGFTITLRHTTGGRIPLDEWSDRHRDLYLTTHNTQNTQTSMPPAGFEPTIPASKRRQTHPLDARTLGSTRQLGYEKETMSISNSKDEWITGNKECKCIWICGKKRLSTDNRARISLDILQWHQWRTQWATTTPRIPAELTTVVDKQKASNSQRFDGGYWLCHKRRGCSML
jgi:hypothetical protein